MPRALRLFATLALVAQAGFATIIIAVGTSDGLLLCEDRRLTVRSSTGQVSYADANKAQQLGKFGFFAVTGEVSAAFTNVVGRTTTTFDILSGIPAFFNTHDIQQFDEPAALEFEAQLRAQLNQEPGDPSRRPTGPRLKTEVWLYWMDTSGRTRLYIVDISDGLLDRDSPSTASSSETPAPPRPVGHFVSLDSFKTSRPLVTGRGVVGYNAIVAGHDPALDDLRQDDELKPFLSNFVDAATIDSISATRSLKKLIRQISDRQLSINSFGLDVGPDSDCFLGTADGIKNINQ